MVQCVVFPMDIGRDITHVKMIVQVMVIVSVKVTRSQNNVHGLIQVIQFQHVTGVLAIIISIILVMRLRLVQVRIQILHVEQSHVGILNRNEILL